MNRRILYALGTLVSLMLACGAPSAAAPTAFPLPPTPNFQPLPLATSPASAPAAQPAATGFRDDFDGSLGAGWQWLGEDPARWNMTSTPGHLRITTGNATIRDGQPRNFLVRAAPQGDFEIATAVRFTPTSNFQLAGLLVYASQGNALQFGQAYAQCSDGAVGQCVYFDNYIGGQIVQPNYGTFAGGASLLYLRLRRTGATYTTSYSTDGSGWADIGSHQSTIVPAYVGLISAQGFNGEVPADFDYFTLTEGP
jgi:beta-xylosidase